VLTLGEGGGGGGWTGPYTPPVRRCDTCQWWRPRPADWQERNETKLGADDASGVCHYEAPRATNAWSAFPMTYANDFCREWHDAKDPV